MAHFSRAACLIISLVNDGYNTSKNGKHFPLLGSERRALAREPLGSCLADDKTCLAWVSLGFTIAFDGPRIGARIFIAVAAIVIGTEVYFNVVHLCGQAHIH